MFVLAGNTYIYKGNSIYGIDIDGTTIKSSKEYATNVDMEFIGQDYKQAYFYSDFNQTIYAYVGYWDFIPYVKLTNFSKVKKIAIDQARQILIVHADDKILIVREGKILEVPWRMLPGQLSDGESLLEPSELFGTPIFSKNKLFLQTKKMSSTSTRRKSDSHFLITLI